MVQKSNPLLSRLVKSYVAGRKIINENLALIQRRYGLLEFHVDKIPTSVQSQIPIELAMSEDCTIALHT